MLGLYNSGKGRIQRGLDSIRMFPDTPMDEPKMPTEEPEGGDSKAA